MTTREKFEELLEKGYLTSDDLFFENKDMRQKLLFLKAAPHMRACIGLPHFANQNVMDFVDYLYDKYIGQA